ncbi:class I SAM-dependent methyltransferase [Nocardia cyriacigeorgica]|uniref:class I SAM-dependent methyltransferase n=1 Tax=Nocardia cyriacigeorgica TaxID=135487 RepID=UPI00351403CF
MISLPDRSAAPTGADAVKACCADAYSSDVVALLLGDSYHPGGAALTRRLADRLALRGGERVLDVACGPGTTARLLAVEHSVIVDGIDLAETTLSRARTATDAAGLSDQVHFRVGDAEQIPFPDNTFGAVVCECALCLFPDKARAAAEFARVLRPGGRVGITDITVAGSGLPLELTGLAAHIACIADARPIEVYRDLLTAAGLRVTTAENHPAAVNAMIDHIQTRLALARTIAPTRLAESGLDPTTAQQYLTAARRAVCDRLIGYILLIAEKPR